MKKILFIIVLTVIGSYVYQQQGLDFLQQNPSNGLVKCTTQDGKVIYGKQPSGTVCKKIETVKGSLTILSRGTTHEKESVTSTSNVESLRNSVFKCDGRTYCSQMTSCEEARFFINNCPNTQMDGDNDGIPCEKQWC